MIAGIELAARRGARYTPATRFPYLEGFNVNWLRLYTDALNKRKVQSLPGELFKAWINFLMIARKHDGYLLPVPDIAFELHVSDEVAETWLLALIHRGLFDRTPSGVRPHDWDQHQYASDSSTERVRKHRQKTPNKQPETLMKRFSNGTEQSRADTEQIKAAAAEAPPSTIEEARLLIAAYPDARDLMGAPDSVLAAQCLNLAGGDLVELGRGLRALNLTGKKPSLSWGWFKTVLPTYLRKLA